MTVRVLLFGPFADAAGGDHAALALAADRPATAAHVLDALGDAHPPLRPMLSAARLAVNGVLVRADAVVRESDELAVIGLVGGG